MSLALVIPDEQLGAALEALARAGIGVETLTNSEPPAPAEPEVLDLFGGTAQGRAPAGSWTIALPGGIAGEVAQSAGQVAGGFTVWLTAAAGDSIAWSLTAECQPVPLERGPCPSRLLSSLGSRELERIRTVATEMLEA